MEKNDNLRGDHFPTVEISCSSTPDACQFPSPVEVEEMLSKDTQHTEGESNEGQNTPE